MWPEAERVSPRTKLPPPTTTATWQPVLATVAISSHRLVSSLASRPKPPSRQRPSPETFSRMRRYLASDMNGSQGETNVGASYGEGGRLASGETDKRTTSGHEWAQMRRGPVFNHCAGAVPEGAFPRGGCASLLPDS